MCPKIPESKHFGRLTSNSYNSQNIWPIARKFVHNLDKEITYNFVTNHFYNKPHFAYAKHLATESVQNNFYNWILEQ